MSNHHPHRHEHSGLKSCGHAHHHGHSNRGVRNIVFALSANMSFALVELVGGVWTQSTAIQADAIHDFGDSAALAAALLLQLIATAPPRAGFSYGLRRFSLLSAIMTSILLVVGSTYVAYQAVSRLSDPVTPHLDGMFALAILGVAVNGFAAWRMSRGQSQNEKALTWHMIEDLLGWIAILISSFAMRFWNMPWLDPVLALVVGFIVLAGASRSFWSSLRLFLQAVPRGIIEEDLRQKISGVAGVKAVSDLQVWSLDGEHHVCTLRVEVSTSLSGEEWNQRRQAIAAILAAEGQFASTIEPVFV